MSALQAPPAGVRTWETDHGVKLRMPTAAYPYYRIDYRLGGIRRTPCAGRDWQAAWAEANRIDALVAAECGAQSQLAVRDLAAQWFAAESRRWRSQRHREDTRGYLDRVILPGIGKVPLDTLRRSDIRALLEAIPRDSVERKVRNVVGAMLAWGHAEQWLGITREALMPPPRRSEDADDEGTYVDPAEIPDESDVVALYRALREPRTFASKHARAYTPPEWLSMMPVLAACTGARQGECFALQGKDVSGDRLLIDQQVQLVAGRPTLVLPKMGRIRTVVLSSHAFGLDVRQWMCDRARQVGPDGLLFPTPRGHLWRRGNYLADSFTPARLAAWGSLRWPFHGLRHHAATRMLQRGIDIKDISLMLGHKSVRITQDMYISHQASALDRISALI